MRSTVSTEKETSSRSRNKTTWFPSLDLDYFESGGGLAQDDRAATEILAL
jgi:hypothetical protein